jgi:hypothetical protein
MAVQTTYSENMRAGLPGLVVGSDYDIDTGNCETAAGLAFGIAVSQGAADKGVIIGGTRAGFRGITVRDVTLESDQLDKYAQYQNVGVLTRGKIWVTVAAAVAAHDPVHFVAATGVLTNTGAEGPVNGARYVTSAAINGLALVELKGYQRSA